MALPRASPVPVKVAWRALGILLVAAGVAMSGCFGGQADDSGESAAKVRYGGLVLQQEPGSLKGLVVDEAIRPIAGASVRVVEADQKTTTSQGGLFTFLELASRSYTVEVTAPGYLPTAVAASVFDDQVGQVVKVILQADAGAQPYFLVQRFEGFIVCSLNIHNTCTQVNEFTGSEVVAGDNSRWLLRVDPGPTYLQSEMTWDSTQFMGTDLYFEQTVTGEGCGHDLGTLGSGDVGDTSGPSPLRLSYASNELATFQLNRADCALAHKAFAGDSTDAPPFGFGAAVQQDFTWYATAFYSYAPPPEWIFVRDGPYPPPT